MPSTAHPARSRGAPVRWPGPGVLLALSVSVLFASCDPVDVDVIRVPPGPLLDGGLASCARHEDCHGGQLCEKDACGALLGHCVPQPSASLCPGDHHPECGCDGVNYWNSCLRRAARVEARDPSGVCNLVCDPSTPCPRGSVCVRLLGSPGECSTALEGACYGVPETCQGGPASHYVPCGNLNQCLDTCAAMRSGQPAFEQACL